MDSTTQKFLPNPRKSANFISVLLFAWTIPIFRRGLKKPFDGSTVYDALEADRSSHLGDRLEKNWQHEYKTKQKPSLVKVIVKTFWYELVLLGVLCFVNDVVIRLTLPFLLDNLLSYFRKNTEISHENALQYGTAIFVVTIISGFGVLHYFYNTIHYAMRVRVAVCSLIYRKALRLSQKSLIESAPGKLVNLLSNDVSRFDVVAMVLHPLWTSPLMTIIAAYILWREIRWAGVVGMTIIFLVVPLQSYVGNLSKIYRFQIALRTDERVRFMDEIIAGVQVIKFYVWEKPFAKLIAAARSSEMKIILKNAYVRALYMTFSVFTTRMALYCTILSIVLMYGREAITVSKIFMISYMFTSISLSMCQSFVRGVAEALEVLVAMKRIQTFLQYEENESGKNIDTISDTQLESRNLAILLKNISAAWVAAADSNGISEKHKIKEKKNKKKLIGSYTNGKQANGFDNQPITLQNIDTEFGKGKLIGIIGEVGAGKSSLIQVLLGELSPSAGSIGINGSISYSSQEPWNFAASVQQNITFGETLDRMRYDAVIKCTALRKDLQQFAAGDQTMIGERGISLSGGQKARINLARAVYRKADIYLMDDPLSAVDAHVGSQLFDECIGPKGFLARQNSTRILATHQVHFLKEADWIIVLRHGKIEAQGTYLDILNSGIDFASILAHRDDETAEDATENAEILRSNSISPSSRSTVSMKVLAAKSEVKTEKLEEENELLARLEESSKGKVKGSLLLKYLQSAKQPITLAFLLISVLGVQLLASAADIWASYWIRNEEIRVFYSRSNQTEDIEAAASMWTTNTYASIYGGIMFLLLSIAMARSVAFFYLCALSSQNLHDNMFNGLISTAMRFFDTNPSGRILNRFSKDIGAVDEALPKILLDSIQINLAMVGAIAVTLYVNFKFGAIILLLGIAFMVVRHIYLRVSTDLKRLEGMTKSPVYTHITATLGGLSTIRAFKAQKILQNEFDNHQNLNTAIFHISIGLAHGFGLSLDFMVYTFIGCVIYIYLLVNPDATGDRVGLVITQALTLTGLLQWGVRQGTEVSNQLMSVERVMEYSKLDPEKQPEQPVHLINDWPSKGQIEFKKVSYRHFVDAEPVLREITFAVHQNEKIGIVGRTGAGKSSLIGCLFRLALVDGDILIDDINTENIELKFLRSRISIIPQDPVLFSGTLRRNLDPFEEYSDDALWQSLEDVELKESFSSTDGLETAITSHGSNLSVGQRQLLCLARALLRNNRILVLDEATANVDPRTDKMIQQTIREKFAQCTVLTVAHRLHTIIDSDRIMVLDTGAIIEYDQPHVLLSNTNGAFHKMVEATGPQEFEKLSHIAKEKYENCKNLHDLIFS